jgi:CRISPR-associated protein Csm3
MEENINNNGNEIQFQKNIIITGKIVCDTGLYIGDQNDSLEIGGVDNMIIRDKKSNLPYIPGSSLKGKLRSLLELYDPVSTKNIINKTKGDACNCGKCTPCKIFGFSNDDGSIEFKGPTRIIIRDSFPDDDTIKFWNKSHEVSRGAELKTENRIDRIKSTAKDPRPTERVPKNSKFDFEIVFSIYCDDDEKNFKKIFNAMQLLEDNYLGGNGTRGYGKISFKDFSAISRDREYYSDNNDNESSVLEKTKTFSEYNHSNIKLNDKEKLNNGKNPQNLHHQ